MRNPRPSTSYRRFSSTGPFPTRSLSTNCPTKDEVFASLEYVSEVKKASTEFISRFGHSKAQVKDIQPKFKAFIRQAKTFYESAELLHHRASPLLYYYSFLNLAKSYLCLHRPNFVGGNIHHGLQHTFTNGGLKKQNVKVKHGVFPQLYNQLYGNTFPLNTNISIINALGYSSDIAFEYEKTNYGYHRLLRTRYRIFLNDKEAFATIGVNRFELIEQYKTTLTGFNKFFEEVDLTNITAKEIFNFYAEEKSQFRFFESKNIYPVQPNYEIDIIKECHSAIKNIYVPATYSDSYDFSLSLPLSKKNQLAFNEFLGIYTGMFFLGSLIRYHPYYIEDLLASKDAWIIERFARSAPLSLLLNFSNHIHQAIYLYKPR
jgi:YaaC-like Protein